MVRYRIRPWYKRLLRAPEFFAVIYRINTRLSFGLRLRTALHYTWHSVKGY